MLLAAGLGSRLRPWTDDRPKCMVEVAGRPFIDWTIDWLVSQGITELVINLHHRPEVLSAHLGNGRTLGLSIQYSREEWLRGTAGAVAAASALGSKSLRSTYQIARQSHNWNSSSPTNTCCRNGAG